jgi:FAD/FMN-containing dehydrogenase
MSGKHTKAIIDLCKPVFAKYGIDFSAGFVYSNPRAVVVLMHIFYDKENVEETGRAMALYNEVAELTVRAGYPQYRTSLIYMDRILQASGQYHDFVNRLKSVLDPQNVLSPGRYGIGL